MEIKANQRETKHTEQSMDWFLYMSCEDVLKHEFFNLGNTFP